MRTKTLLLLAVLLASATVCFAADPQMGTWKLNEAKSKMAPGAPKNHTVVYSAEGDKIKVAVDGVDAAGKPSHNEWVGKFDGKDYPVKGSPLEDTRAYKRVDDHTLELSNKKDGKTTITGKIAVSADGKTRTVTLESTDAKGKKTTSTAVYDKK